MENIYHLNEAAGKLSYQPFANNRRIQPFIYLGILMLVALTVVYLTGIEVNKWIRIGLLAIGCMLLFRGIYKRYIKSRVVLTFDKGQKTVYRKSAWGHSQTIILFEQIGDILAENEGGAYYYYLTNKENRFAKNIRLSGLFNASKDSKYRQVFDEVILPKIREALSLQPKKLQKT